MDNKFKKQLGNLRNQRQFMVMLIFLFVIVVFWTGLSLIGSRQKVAISSELRNLAKPLNPTINEAVLEKIEVKKYYSDQELTNFNIYKVISTKDGSVSRLVNISAETELLELTPTPTPEVEPTPTSVPSVQEENPQATPAANTI